MRKTATLIVLTLSLVLSLAACGGAGKAAVPSATINVALTEFKFMPDTFTVPAGQQITLNAKNNGTVVHNFVIMKLGASASTPWSDANVPNVYWQLQLEPGASQSTTFTAPSTPGDYQVVCSTPGHLEAGMTANLTVVVP